MRFTINLATKVYINAVQVRAYALVALLLLTVLVILNIKNIATNKAESERIGKDIAQLESRRQPTGTGVPEKDYQNLLARINFANTVIDRKSFNWLVLLNRLEEVVPEGLAITSLEPDLKTQTLKLSAVSRSFNPLKTFMENLENSRIFSDVYLLSESDEASKDGTHRILFNLSCKMAMQ